MKRNNAISPEAVVEGVNSVTDLLRRRVQLAGELDRIISQLGEVFGELCDLQSAIGKEVVKNLSGDTFRSVDAVEASGVSADRISSLVQIRIAGLFNPYSVASDHLSLKEIFERESSNIAEVVTAPCPPRETFLESMKRIGYVVHKYEGP